MIMAQVFLWVGRPFCHPTNSVKVLEGTHSTNPDHWTPTISVGSGKASKFDTCPSSVPELDTSTSTNTDVTVIVWVAR